jgi:hypothetical protein
VTDLVPLEGGLEIYGADQHGNRVYIPANSSLRDHQYVLAAGQLLASHAESHGHGISGIIQPQVLPVISSAASRQLARGHKVRTAAAFCGGIQLGKSAARSHESFRPLAHASSRAKRFEDLSDSMCAGGSVRGTLSHVSERLSHLSDGLNNYPLNLNSPSRGPSRGRSEHKDAPSQRPEYGYAGNRSFTPEGRFTGVMDFLTQAPEQVHASYNKTKLGDFYQLDLAENRKHYMDPLDHNQLPQDQSQLSQPAHVPRVSAATPALSRLTTPAWNGKQLEAASRIGTAGSAGRSRLNTAGSRLNTAGSRLVTPHTPHSPHTPGDTPLYICESCLLFLPKP